jgi:hypothetical protein
MRCGRHDDIFRYFSGLKQAWVLTPDGTADGRPDRLAFLSAMRMYGYSVREALAEYEQLDWLVYPGEREETIARLEEILVALARQGNGCEGGHDDLLTVGGGVVIHRAA